MGRKNSPSAKKELVTLITNYEEAKAENRQLYLDADQLAGIADWYASERKFEEAHPFLTVRTYCQLTGLLRSSGTVELRKLSHTPGTGIGFSGIGSHRVYIKSEE